MADGTKIEWTDATANYVNGCTVYSPGCTNCYAMRLAGTRLRNHPTREGMTIDTKAGPVWNGLVRRNKPVLRQVLSWRRPRMIFWNAHGDLFHEDVPDEWIDAQVAVMASTPHHTHQVLTKRSVRMREYINRLPERVLAQYGSWEKFGDFHLDGIPHITAEQWPLPNVWLGVSVEDQKRADERIPDLLATPAAVRWISAEPLLGAVNLLSINTFAFPGCELVDAIKGVGMDFLGEPMRRLPKIDWVVVGGESGVGARPMHPGWARALREQCAGKETAFLFKQWGDWFPYGEIDGDGHLNTRTRGEKPEHWHEWPAGEGFSCRIGKRQAGRVLDGVTHDGFPA